MKVGFSAPLLPPKCYGVGRYSFDLLNALNEKKIETFVFGDIGNHKFKGINTNKKNKQEPFSKWMSFYFHYRSGLKALEKNADIYHKNTVGAFSKKVPNIQIAHQTVHQIFTGKKKSSWLDTVFYNKAQKIVAVSPLTEELLKNRVDKDKLVTIPPGVWLKSFKKEKKQDFVFFAGRLSKDKNIKTLVDAASDFKVKLKIAGSKFLPTDILNESLTKKVENLGFINNREDFLKKMAEAKIFVLPSKFETFGIVGIEALASHTPLVVSENAGVSRYLTDGKDAVIVKPTREGIVEGVNSILDSDTLNKKLVKNGLKTAKKFDWSKIVEQYIKLYKEILE
ncbi:MAG: glycosyltransferase family 4 protein [Candidatus Altiarchaeota archaeon]|nr:glycosyltransferase family 4 protein [Candidatus Altiarchaeota archaeon]